MTMKEFIKSITGYNYFFGIIHRTSIYKWIKKILGQRATFVTGNPSKWFFVIGVTWTDGKTTTCNLIHHILNTQVGKTLLISTANIKIGDQEIFNSKKMTSLDIKDLLTIMAQGKSQWCTIAIIEVSSHGLDQLRFEGIQFDMAILTNITPEHLDYHGTFEEYVEAKKTLFHYVLTNTKTNKIAILPKDDETWRQRAEQMTFDNMITFGIRSTAMMRANNVQQYRDHTSFSLEYLWNQYPVNTSLVWEFNVYNCIAAMSAATAIGLPIEKSINAIQSFTQVNGRMNMIEYEWVTYIIDYAHTPHALESVLSYTSSIKESWRLIHVFGATGNRDRYKRAEMGQISVQLSDISIITDDDPDIENRLDIISELTQSISHLEGDTVHIIPEREFAIMFAKNIAQQGDIVVITGLWHQQIQITNYGIRTRNDSNFLQTLCTKAQ